MLMHRELDEVKERDRIPLRCIAKQRRLRTLQDAVLWFAQLSLPNQKAC